MRTVDPDTINIWRRISWKRQGWTCFLDQKISQLGKLLLRLDWRDPSALNRREPQDLPMKRTVLNSTTVFRRGTSHMTRHKFCAWKYSLNPKACKDCLSISHWSHYSEKTTVIMLKCQEKDNECLSTLWKSLKCLLLLHRLDSSRMPAAKIFGHLVNNTSKHINSFN